MDLLPSPKNPFRVHGRAAGGCAAAAGIPRFIQAQRQRYIQAQRNARFTPPSVLQAQPPFFALHIVVLPPAIQSFILVPLRLYNMLDLALLYLVALHICGTFINPQVDTRRGNP